MDTQVHLTVILVTGLNKGKRTLSMGRMKDGVKCLRSLLNDGMKGEDVAWGFGEKSRWMQMLGTVFVFLSWNVEEEMGGVCSEGIAKAIFN